MKEFKCGDIVIPTDGSYIMELPKKGKIKQVVDGRTITGRKFEILAVDCDLPSDNLRERNDTILRALDNNQIIFIMDDQIILHHRCNSCPSCGEKLK